MSNTRLCGSRKLAGESRCAAQSKAFQQGTKMGKSVLTLGKDQRIKLSKIMTIICPGIQIISQCQV